MSRDEKMRLSDLKMLEMKAKNEAWLKRLQEIEEDKRLADALSRQAALKMTKSTPATKSASVKAVPTQKGSKPKNGSVYKIATRTTSSVEHASDKSSSDKVCPGTPPSEPENEFSGYLQRDFGSHPDDDHRRRPPNRSDLTDWRTAQRATFYWADGPPPMGGVGRGRLLVPTPESQRPSFEQMAAEAEKRRLQMTMTGAERIQYQDWRCQRDQADQERLARQRTDQGNWKREWDRGKDSKNSEPTSWDFNSKADNFNGGNKQKDPCGNSPKNSTATTHGSKSFVESPEECWDTEVPSSQNAEILKISPEKERDLKKSKDVFETKRLVSSGKASNSIDENNSECWDDQVLNISKTMQTNLNLKNDKERRSKSDVMLPKCGKSMETVEKLEYWDDEILKEQEQNAKETDIQCRDGHIVSDSINFEASKCRLGSVTTDEQSNAQKFEQSKWELERCPQESEDIAFYESMDLIKQRMVAQMEANIVAVEAALDKSDAE